MYQTVLVHDSTTQAVNLVHAAISDSAPSPLFITHSPSRSRLSVLDDDIESDIKSKNGIEDRLKSNGRRGKKKIVRKYNRDDNHFDKYGGNPLIEGDYSSLFDKDENLDPVQSSNEKQFSSYSVPDTFDNENNLLRPNFPADVNYPGSSIKDFEEEILPPRALPRTSGKARNDLFPCVKLENLRVTVRKLIFISGSWQFVSSVVSCGEKLGMFTGEFVWILLDVKIPGELKPPYFNWKINRHNFERRKNSWKSANRLDRKRAMRLRRKRGETRYAKIRQYRKKHRMINEKPFQQFPDNLFERIDNISESKESEHSSSIEMGIMASHKLPEGMLTLRLKTLDTVSDKGGYLNFFKDSLKVLTELVVFDAYITEEIKELEKDLLAYRKVSQKTLLPENISSTVPSKFENVVVHNNISDIINNNIGIFITKEEEQIDDKLEPKEEQHLPEEDDPFIDLLNENVAINYTGVDFPSAEYGEGLYPNYGDFDEDLTPNETDEMTEPDLEKYVEQFVNFNNNSTKQEEIGSMFKTFVATDFLNSSLSTKFKSEIPTPVLNMELPTMKVEIILDQVGSSSTSTNDVSEEIRDLNSGHIDETNNHFQSDSGQPSSFSSHHASKHSVCKVPSNHNHNTHRNSQEQLSQQESQRSLLE